MSRAFLDFFFATIHYHKPFFIRSSKSYLHQTVELSSVWFIVSATLLVVGIGEVTKSKRLRKFYLSRMSFPRFGSLRNHLLRSINTITALYALFKATRY